MSAAIKPALASGEEAQADYNSLEQAAHWYASLQGEHPSQEQKNAWQEWLDARPQNRQAWRHVEAISHRFMPLRTDQRGERDAAAVAVNVSSAQSRKRRTLLRSLAALGGAGLSGWLGWRYAPAIDTVAAWRADHHTAVGEVRDLMLPDGTHIWLNTHSAVDLAFDDSRRLLILRVGEVLVDTARDAAARPFFVDTDAGRMQALGTRFTVSRQGSDTRLAVFAGSVEITNQAGQVVIVPTGEERQFSDSDIGPAKPADAARQAWTRGVIQAEDIPLGELLTQLSRYQHGYIGVSPDIAGLRVSGRYPVDDMARSIGMLERDLPIEVSRPLPWWINIRKK